MKRATARIVLFLLLGAIINVAVAWGCVVAVPIALRPAEITIQELSADYQQVQCVQRAFGRTRETWGERYALPVVIDSGSPFGQRPAVSSWERTGWPMRALYCSTSAHELAYTTDGGEVLAAGSEGKIDQGIELSPERFAVSSSPLRVSTWRALPLRPLWPGFAVNTIIYAVILWLLTFCPFTLRRCIRRKHGQCTKCGHDLRGADHPACPECGHGRECA
ncbi:MAG: hypothetical protein IIB53_12465 [Planctomycetes bacterium]|nr:hypothetical protein [Planctomycetota bacterium]